MSEKYKSTKLLEAAIREHRGDYKKNVGKYQDGVIYGLTLALGVVNNDDEVPAADVEPVVRGTWINDEDYPDSGLKVCSTCGHDPLLNGHEERVLSKRCPNCGAHMSTERSGSGE